LFKQILLCYFASQLNTTMTTQGTTETKTWGIDKSHSHVNFKVKHLMITTVTGALSEYEGTIETLGDDFSKAKINFSADAASMTTGDAQRDGHLKTADFFEAEVHPKITFSSTGMEQSADGNFVLNGDLTMRGVTNPVSLNVEFAGIAKDPWGNAKAGFSIEGKISRKDWGLNWNAALETGGVLVSDEVRILCDVQLIQQA